MREFEFEITKSDCKNYVKDIYKLPNIKKAHKVSYIVNAITALCLSIFISTLYPFLWTNLLILISSIIIFSVILYMFFCKCMYLGSPRIMFNSLKGTDLKRKITIDENGLTNVNETVSSTVPWQGVKSVHNGKNTIVVFIGDVQGIIFPKRIFPSEEEATKFYDEILEYYNKK